MSVEDEWMGAALVVDDYLIIAVFLGIGVLMCVFLKEMKLLIFDDKSPHYSRFSFFIFVC